MKRDFSSRQLDVAFFAETSSRLTCADALTHFPRLAAEVAASAETMAQVLVQWQAQGERRGAGTGKALATWLHLTAKVQLPLACQRCLEPVSTLVTVDRWFRFAADEATAAAEDEESEEDVLAMRRDFNLLELLEDELLMALPIMPYHAQCPEAVTMSAADPGFASAQEERASPFAALETLRPRKNSSVD